jgi:hypothetical protein
MGAYWYLLRSPKLVRTVKVERPDGSVEIHVVGVFSFLCKPYRSFFEREPKWMRAYKMQIARMEQIWAKYKRPQFGVTVSNLDEGLKELPPKLRNQIKPGLTVEYFYHPRWPQPVDSPILPEEMNVEVPIMFNDEADGRKPYGKVIEILK